MSSKKWGWHLRTFGKILQGKPSTDDMAELEEQLRSLPQLFDRLDARTLAAAQAVLEPSVRAATTAKFLDVVNEVKILYLDLLFITVHKS